MSRFPHDAPKKKVLKALESLGFHIIREKEHLSMERANTDGTKTPLTMPNHPTIKASTLRIICTQAGISREEFLKVYSRQ
jgi:predicted RNA binding protein YcfA (HicA-like mRNA interferase family)